MPDAPRSASPAWAALSSLHMRRAGSAVTIWLSLVAAALLIAAPLSATGAGFTALGMPGSQLLALSRDGRAGAGSLVGAGSGGFRWSEGKGVQPLSGAISVRGVSASGRYVAGSSLDALQREVASYWTADGRLVRLGGLPDTAWQGGLVSVAFGISDEPRVVGIASSSDQHTVAFEWTADGGMHALPLPVEARTARAGGVSDDGRHIYGWFEPVSGPRRGVLWTDGRPKLLSGTHGVDAGEVLGGNRDDTVLLGIDIPHPGIAFAYRWRADTGPQPLTLPAQPSQFVASSDDGRVLVGSVGTGAICTAVVWTTKAGQQPLAALLAARGITIPTGWALATATGISGDGRRIGGWGQHDGYLDSFVVDLPDAAASPAVASASTGAAASQ